MTTRPEKIPGTDHAISIADTHAVLRLQEAKSINAVWSYEKPYAAVSSIAHHLAFFWIDSTEDTT